MAAIADAMREKYLLPKLLGKCARSYRCRCSMAKSTCYYYAGNTGVSPKKKKNEERVALIKDIFFDNKEIYGYRRIKAALKRAWHVISEKVIRRLMKALCLKVKGKRTRKYSSCGGEISPAAENLVQRNS